MKSCLPKKNVRQVEKTKGGTKNQTKNSTKEEEPKKNEFLAREGIRKQG